ncbi:MAG: hypothetical protein KDA89_01015 [Planctomycetaceae bacterium]|nr:hypothetical protein [Planctomycetaceae bacterium]
MPADRATSVIRVRGAGTHNLQNIDVDLPLGRLIVMTGVSGSGKSSLAFDTLFAEGQRRYLESVSVHTRTLLRRLPRPDVDEISGLPPTVSVDQRVTTVPARSTLAVTTEIYDFLRLLYARAGVAHCTQCGRPVESRSVESILEQLHRLPERTKLMILSPMVRARRGAHREVFERIARNGFVRCRVDGELRDMAEIPDLKPTAKHSIEAVVDRIILKDGIASRLRESVELAVRESDGSCIVCLPDGDGWQDRLFSTRFSCADCDLSFPAPEPRTFSFNSAWGACPECSGFGVRGIADDSEDITVFRQAPCPECHGSRLQPFAAGVTFGGLPIHAFAALSVSDALGQLDNWQTNLSELPQDARLVARKTLPEIRQRLQCLRQVGIGYLTLDRPTRTLSGGEYQRARLAACLGIGLHGACFVLDEPTTGLHPRDTESVLSTLRKIRDAGGTVVVVEHDGEMMRAADHLIDLGPGAGTGGGRLLYSGPVDDPSQFPDSPTSRYLNGTLTAPVSPNSGVSSTATLFPETEDLGRLRIRTACLNNLADLTVDIPLGKLVCVTGVSGSGKSSLMVETLLPVAEAWFRRPESVSAALADARCAAVDGLDQLKRVTSIDQSPLRRSRRSCIATYSRLWDEVRRVFAKTRTARARGYTPQRFSFNSGDGRCPECKGSGIRDLKMAFLPDAVVPCPACRGTRFSQATLSVKYSDRSVDDVLRMRVDEAAEFFAEIPKLCRTLNVFRDVGLGYVTLGRRASTFSGGEAQRVRLATELSDHRLSVNQKTELPTLYILDEPTSGLHPADVVHLLNLLRQLVAGGHSVVVIEHNVDVMMHSDWIIDIGPGSAADGGRLVAEGTVRQIAASADSVTGKYLPG